MPKITATVECPLFDSFRVRQVAGMFDLKPEEHGRKTFTVEVPGLDEAWTIGAIVGPSGSGKTTVARAAFGDCVVTEQPWPRDRAVIDAIDDGAEAKCDVKQIVATLTAVGFSSPPAWLKPWHVLSRGEQFRCDVARAVLERGRMNDERGTQVAVIDEFTSTLDRTTAQMASAALAKSIRDHRSSFRVPFVLVTCHNDILPWLAPDWTLDMTTGRLASVSSAAET